MPTPTLTERDALIIAGLDALDAQMARCSKIIGVDQVDRLEEFRGAGQVTLCEAADLFDPARGVPWLAYANKMIRFRFMTMATKFKLDMERGMVPRQLDYTDADGENYQMPADPKSCDPADIAAARELLDAPGGLNPPSPPGVPHRLTPPPRVSQRAKQPKGELLAAAPTPQAAAVQAARLKAAMFRPIDEKSVEAIMANVVAMAKGGDHRSIKIVIDLVCAKLVVNAILAPDPDDRVVIVNRGDVS